MSVSCRKSRPTREGGRGIRRPAGTFDCAASTLPRMGGSATRSKRRPASTCFVRNASKPKKNEPRCESFRDPSRFSLHAQPQALSGCGGAEIWPKPNKNLNRAETFGGTRSVPEPARKPAVETTVETARAEDNARFRDGPSW